ncbi:ABC transporter substrate-binding protein [Bacillaceae bacterium]
MVKRRWVFALTLAMSLLFLAACGASTTGSSEGQADSGSAGQEKAEGESGASGDAQAKKAVKIGITQYVEHPSLDEARKGFLDALKENGYVEGENLQVDVQIAQGDPGNNLTIAQKLVADGNDLILAVSTPSAQAVAKQTKEIPLLFTAVTDPLGAKLVESIEKPGGNVTGTSDTHPDAIRNTVQTIKEFFPEAKAVGLIYNSGEQNSVADVENAKKAIQEAGLQAVEVTVSNSSEVKQAADSLVGRTDVLYVLKDNTVVSALESVVQVANDHDIPLFVGEADSVARGGFAAYGLSYYDLGYKTGKMAVEILNGKNPGEIPVGFPDNLELVINEKAAEAQGVQLTDAMKSNAKILTQ